MSSRDANEDGLKFLVLRLPRKPRFRTSADHDKRDETMYEDATDKIKRANRNKTLVDPFGYTSHK